MAQMKEQNKTPAKELNGYSQPIRCRIQNSGDQDAQRTQWQQHKGRNEGYIKWNKGKHTENQHDGEETRTQINGLYQKEEINSQPEQNEETRIQKNEERLRNLQDNLKCSNIRIIGVPEREEEEQETENIFE